MNTSTPDRASTDTTTPAAPRTAEQTTGRTPRFHPLVRILIALAVFELVSIAAYFGLEPLLTPIAERGSIELGATVYALMQVSMTVFAVLALWAIMRFIDRRPLRELGWRWTKWSIVMLLLGIVCAAVLVVAGQAIAMATGLVPAPVETPGDAGGGGDISQFSVYVIIVSVLQAFILKPFLLQAVPEELFFRGYMLQTWRERPGAAIAVSTIVFGAVHIVSSGGQQNLAERFVYLLPAAAFGFFAAVLLVWTRSVWAAVGVHGGFHLGTIVANGMGTTETPAVWVANATLFALAGAVLLWIAARQGRLRNGIVIDR